MSFDAPSEDLLVAKLNEVYDCGVLEREHADIAEERDENDVKPGDPGEA